MKFLGIDVGSSSVKVALLDGATGKALAQGFHPKSEMPMEAKEAGWAEQHPQMWWESLLAALSALKEQASLEDVSAIGISYQMHGLVAVDAQQQPVRPSIIWCDSRAVEIGESAFQAIGEETSLSQLLNSPGNFTASKLAWVKANEPELYSNIAKIMLPGDYIAMRLTGEISTTATGLSEGILWDFRDRTVSKDVMGHYAFDDALIPEIRPTIGEQCKILPEMAAELGINPNAIISYRAGDQPNNALSLNVLEPGEIATTAGTSAVVYGVANHNCYDTGQRVNTFLHVNDTNEQPRNGILLCVNGSGILYSWLKNLLGLGYEEMNNHAAEAPIGADGVSFYPFGNGAERVLVNKNPMASLWNINFNLHDDRHVIRAAKEGIVFAMNYGVEVFKEMKIPVEIMRAGYANLFQSPLFREAFVNTTGAPLELYETDGAVGAARAAGIGVGHWSTKEAFGGLEKIEVIEPQPELQTQYQEAYAHWKQGLDRILKF
ncbi:MAG: FGGY family carbohydrate kinase [Bacteroidota bacterium]